MQSCQSKLLSVVAATLKLRTGLRVGGWGLRGGVLYFFGLCALSILVRTLVLADLKDPGRRIKKRLLDEEEGSELMERRMLLMQTKKNILIELKWHAS